MPKCSETGQTIYYVPEYNLSYTDDQVLHLDYTNWRGVRGWRRVVPLPAVPEFKDKLLSKPDSCVVRADRKAWVWRVYDLDRQAERFYVLTDIHEIRDTPPEGSGAGEAGSENEGV